MSSSFQYYPIESFPIDPVLSREWKSSFQLLLPEETIAADAQSRVKYLGVSSFHDYHKYYVRHETLRNAWIRIDHQDRKSVIFVEEFHVFIPPNFTYALLRTKAEVATEFMNRLRQRSSEFSYKIRKIDLDALKRDLQPQVRGGWFKDLEIQDVKTAAIFGANVSESDEWEKYESYGTLASLVIEFRDIDERLHSVGINSAGSITLVGNYEESHALELAEKFNNILMKYQEELDPRHPRGSKKKA